MAEKRGFISIFLTRYKHFQESLLGHAIDVFVFFVLDIFRKSPAETSGLMMFQHILQTFEGVLLEIHCFKWGNFVL